jgi:hypothetical protein
MNSSASEPVPSLPAVVDRATFQDELDKLRVREKAHTQEWGVSISDHVTRFNGRPIAQWSRVEAGRSDDLTVER